MLEPASAAFAHHQIGLPPTAQIFDLSNACLGFLNALTVAGGLIESGQIRCALVAAGENGRPLVEQTLATLVERPFEPKRDQAVFRQSDDRLRGRRGDRLPPLSRVRPGRTGSSAGSPGRRPRTASSARATPWGPRRWPCRPIPSSCCWPAWRSPRETWDEFRAATGWDRTGSTGSSATRWAPPTGGSSTRRLGLDLAKDYSTFETLGNMGSVSLPATLAAAVEAGAVRPGDRVALFGIGSGLNCMMLALEW